jgi:hypothetical protein
MLIKFALQNIVIPSRPEPRAKRGENERGICFFCVSSTTGGQVYTSAVAPKGRNIAAQRRKPWVKVGR